MMMMCNDVLCNDVLWCFSGFKKHESFLFTLFSLILYRSLGTGPAWGPPTVQPSNQAHLIICTEPVLDAAELRRLAHYEGADFASKKNMPIKRGFLRGFREEQGGRVFSRDIRKSHTFATSTLASQFRVLEIEFFTWFVYQIRLITDCNNPKNPWTLQLRGLNLYSRGPGPQNSHFWGVDP